MTLFFLTRGDNRLTSKSFISSANQGLFSRHGLQGRISKWLVITLLSVFIIVPFSPSITPQAEAVAASTPCTTQFPVDSLWKPIRNTTGGVLTDPSGDSGGSSNVDIYGTEATASAAARSAIDWYSTGINGCFQFRMRILASAINGSRIDNNLWQLAVGTGSTIKAWIVVNGENAGNNDVTIYTPAGAVHKTYTFPLYGADSTTAWATSVGSGASIRYYVYFQVPYNDLISLLGSSTIYGFFAGTSQSNSVTAINRDCLNVSASCSSPSFSSTQQIDLSQNISAAIPAPNITSISPLRAREMEVQQSPFTELISQIQ